MKFQPDYYYTSAAGAAVYDTHCYTSAAGAAVYDTHYYTSAAGAATHLGLNICDLLHRRIFTVEAHRLGVEAEVASLGDCMPMVLDVIIDRCCTKE